MNVDSDSSYFATTDGTVLFSAGVTSIRSILITTEDKGSFSFNTYPSKTDVSSVIESGTLTPGTIYTLTSTAGNYVGITIQPNGTVNLTSIALTWVC
jgi:hypothetical protein